MAKIEVVLGEIIKERGMTQKDLAESAAVRPALVSSLARGHVTQVSLESLERIMTALEIEDVGEILKYVK